MQKQMFGKERLRREFFRLGGWLDRVVLALCWKGQLSWPWCQWAVVVSCYSKNRRSSDASPEREIGLTPGFRLLPCLEVAIFRPLECALWTTSGYSTVPERQARGEAGRKKNGPERNPVECKEQTFYWLEQVKAEVSSPWCLLALCRRCLDACRLVLMDMQVAAFSG